ncbi:MAG: efflux transporter outer membrane subunit [Proteobacteria bacterium]|nr:efflux transporter outer membrane subunit [Pseudomonadota bacterium]
MSLRALAPTLLCAGLAACAVGPDYVRPKLDIPSAYKEAPAAAADWKPAQPTDAVGRGAWWKVFGDATLDALEQQLETANPSLAQSQAQYRQATALVANARAAFFPTLSANASGTRSGRYAGSTNGSSNPADNYGLNFVASWEPDLWGRVRRSVEQSRANAQASAALLASTRLSLQSELAQDYLQLRVTDEQKRLLDDTVAAYQRALTMTQNQYAAGVAARGDVVQAQAQLKSAQAQALDIGIARAQLEHAIAVLVGKPPADFTIAAEPLQLQPPAIPAGVPSQLLERRPDVAVAERQAAAANAAIGIAEAAWFPNLTLSGSGGYQSSSLSKWLTAPSRVWSLGPALAATLFDGGARHAQTAQARAGYDAAVANYRQLALAALQNVEDQLVALRIGEQEARVQDEAAKAAEESLRIAENQYKAGTVSYLNVTSAQNAAYAARRAELSLLGTRLVDSVALVKALGGGWEAGELPR